MVHTAFLTSGNLERENFPRRSFLCCVIPHTKRVTPLFGITTLPMVFASSGRRLEEKARFCFQNLMPTTSATYAPQIKELIFKIAPNIHSNLARHGEKTFTDISPLLPEMCSFCAVAFLFTFSTLVLMVVIWL